MAEVNVSPPPISTSIVDPKTGMPTRPFIEFMHRLWKRTGGDQDTISDLDVTNAYPFFSTAPPTDPENRQPSFAIPERNNNQEAIDRAIGDVTALVIAQAPQNDVIEAIESLRAVTLSDMAGLHSEIGELREHVESLITLVMIIERPGRAASDAVSNHVALPDPHSQYADQATTYTETEVDSLLDDKAAIAGQVFTGEIVYYGAGGLSTNTSYGQGTLSSNTTGQFNTANGRDALSSNTTGDFNTANGREALTVNTTGFKNTANGTNALRSTTTGNKNTAIGMQSLKDITTGNGNTAVGERSGIGIETGSGNSIFGQDADGLASGLENNLILASGGVIRLQHDGVNTTTLQGNLVADKITASTGILFGTDTAAANTLDDYETGTWTPIITDAYGSFPSAITVANGTYTKIGNVVHCRFEIATSSSADVILNDRARFAGMPFNPDDLNIFDGSGTAFQYYLISGGVNAFWSILTGNTTQFILYNTSLDDLPDYTKGISGSFTYTAS